MAFDCVVFLLTLIERCIFSVALCAEGVDFCLVLQDFLSARGTLLIGSAQLFRALDKAGGTGYLLYILLSRRVPTMYGLPCHTFGIALAAAF